MLVLAIFIVNIVFSVIVNVLGENGKKDAYKYVSFSLGSIVICVVTILYVSIVKADICYSLKIKKPHPKYFLYSAMALFACVFGLSGVNNAFINFLSDTFFNGLLRMRFTCAIRRSGIQRCAAKRT